jgi:predicted ArsR family transcriptional regulator
MMRKILALMAGGTPLSIAELSQILGARLPEVEAMLSQLTELGYVQDLACVGDTGKAPGCKGCAVRNACHGGAPQHLWTLTLKGRRASGIASHQVSTLAQP